MRLLLISNDTAAQVPWAQSFNAAGFVLDVLSYDDALESVQTSPYQAVILRPPNTGAAVSWLLSIRRCGVTVPILVLSDRDVASERIAAFENGADDCVRLPVSEREMLARLRAVLRRPALVAETELLAGNARLNPATREVWIAERKIRVTRREVSLLEHLMRRVNRVVSRAHLEAAMYGVSDEVGPNTIDVGISRIRRRLSDAQATVAVQTVRGVGYCLEPH